MSTEIGNINGLLITSFNGEKERGSCIQLTTPSCGYVQLTKEDIITLVVILDNWVKKGVEPLKEHDKHCDMCQVTQNVDKTEVKVLKTLKDLPDWDKYCIYDIEAVGRKDVRQAAIEWVKVMKNKIDDRGMGSVWLDKDTVLFEDSSYGSSDIIGAIKWIQHFFNISEEDLK